ncbi:hypothetical protein [Variovorax sp. RO1]|uniref:hypothetical protein n=1 Tax=Variovorax sp. RO1 TaxID=2066034 RepID=UPI0015DE87C2|nr:hypothetical protein [Variovorax sp. RO1]
MKAFDFSVVAAPSVDEYGCVGGEAAVGERQNLRARQRLELGYQGNHDPVVEVALTPARWSNGLPILKLLEVVV